MADEQEPPQDAPRAIDVRRARVAELYLAGWTQGEIAQEVGISQPVVSRDLSAVKKRYRDVQHESVAEVRRWQVAKAEGLRGLALRSFRLSTLPTEEGGAERPGNPKWLDVALACEREVSKLLGAYAPEKVSVSDATQQEQEFVANALQSEETQELLARLTDALGTSGFIGTLPLALGEAPPPEVVK